MTSHEELSFPSSKHHNITFKSSPLYCLTNGGTVFLVCVHMYLIQQDPGP